MSEARVSADIPEESLSPKTKEAYDVFKKMEAEVKAKIKEFEKEGIECAFLSFFTVKEPEEKHGNGFTSAMFKNTTMPSLVASYVSWASRSMDAMKFHMDADKLLKDFFSKDNGEALINLIREPLKEMGIDEPPTEQ